MWGGYLVGQAVSPVGPPWTTPNFPGPTGESACPTNIIGNFLSPTGESACPTGHKPGGLCHLLLALAVLSTSLAAVPAKRPAKPPAKRPAVRPASKPGNLASLVRDWRETPTPARQALVESYAVAHSKDNTGALARLALGVGEYEQKNYADAVANLKKIQAGLPQIADYAAYYLALARVESNDVNGVNKDLLGAHKTEIRSPLSGKAWLVEARALQTTDAASSVRLLREHYSELPQPEGDVTLGDCYAATQDLPHAVDFYQRVYYQYLTGDAANRAAAALLTWKDAMGAAYPQPLPAQLLRRADRLMEIREYARASQEYQALLDQLNGTARDRARVGVGAADFLGGKTASGCGYLRGLDLAESEADAARQYYLVECARRSTDDDAMMAAVDRLGIEYPRSPWRLKALLSAANRFLLVNRPADYVPLYQAAYEDFPNDPVAGLCHWKVAFQAYLHDRKEAAGLLREHLRNYPGHATTGAALYFLGRHFEQAGDFGSARACYQRLSQSFQNHYYAMLARDRLARPEVTAGSEADVAKFLADLKIAEAKPVTPESTRATSLRIERSRLLRAAGLADFADSELRFGSRTDGQPALLGMEMAEAADFPHQAMRIMKSLAGDYLGLTIGQAPRKYWELLFPLPYRGDLMAGARARELDPYLLAGLIRQESEFNPQARSPANAYGLTQVRPATGRQFARRAGIQRFTSSVLLQPAANLKIGSSILRSMLDQNGGKVEQTLAAYNAGPARVAEWLTWNTYREPAEFVESIPFTETRDYVQAVLRNADIYRRLYR
ncbi:MAG: transglycosylase SLT domain-containing protein [Acidobacteriia bacterium]|nr:transglycosylase SLT domain-containing protein [Terriglobia bacterium]